MRILIEQTNTGRCVDIQDEVDENGLPKCKCEVFVNYADGSRCLIFAPKSDGKQYEIWRKQVSHKGEKQEILAHFSNRGRWFSGKYKDSEVGLVFLDSRFWEAFTRTELEIREVSESEE